MPTLLEKALATRRKRPSVKPPSSEEIEVVVAFLRDEIGPSQLQAAFGYGGAGYTPSSNKAISVLRRAIASGLLELTVTGQGHR